MVACFVGVKMMRPILWIAAAPITVVGIPCPAIIIVASAVRGPLNFPKPALWNVCLIVRRKPVARMDAVGSAGHAVMALCARRVYASRKRPYVAA